VVHIGGGESLLGCGKKRSRTGSKKTGLT